MKYKIWIYKNSDILKKAHLLEWKNKKTSKINPRMMKFSLTNPILRQNFSSIKVNTFLHTSSHQRTLTLTTTFLRISSLITLLSQNNLI